jgi:hypothetical protein
MTSASVEGFLSAGTAGVGVLSLGSESACDLEGVLSGKADDGILKCGLCNPTVVLLYHTPTSMHLIAQLAQLSTGISLQSAS